MRRGAILTVIGLLVLASPANAHRANWCQRLAAAQVQPGAQTITVANEAAIPARELCHVEIAVERQALQLRAAWGTPPITFGSGGWPIRLLPNDNASDVLTYGNAGLHGGAPVPNAYVIVAPACTTFICARLKPWSTTFSHEVMELLVDPGGAGREVCDPVNNSTYRLDGVWVQDFVLPSYWLGRSPIDEIGLAT